MLLLAVPPPVFADELSGELPKSTRDILDEGGTDLSDAARWRFSDLCDTVGAWAAEGLQPALHLAAQSAGYLLLAGLLGLLAGSLGIALIFVWVKAVRGRATFTRLYANMGPKPPRLGNAAVASEELAQQ